MGHLLFRYEELLPTVVHLDNPAADRAVGVLGRLVKEVFLDEALVSVETTFIHEVFGHGARARELGLSATYEFALPQPYSFFLSSHSTFLGLTETNVATGVRDRDIAVTAAGLEANYLTAWWINEQIVASGGWVSASDLDAYLDSKIEYATTFLSRGIRDPALPADDIVAYVNELQDRTNQWRPGDRAGIAAKLQTAYAWNYVDATFYCAIYSLFVNTLYRGDEYSRLPLPAAGSVTFYPETRFNLSPFGAEHYLDVFLRRGNLVADVYGRLGSSGLSSYTGGGVRLDGVKPCRWLSLGAEVDVWNQPELLLSQRNVYDPPELPGFNAALYGTAKVYGALGVTAKLAYKTGGYLMASRSTRGPTATSGSRLRSRERWPVRLSRPRARS